MAPPSRHPLPQSRLAVLGLFAFVGVASSFLVHASTLGYGFDHDDYHHVRPYTLCEVAGTFYGPWDPQGIEVRFYRPLTVAFYAARFWAIGWDAWWSHALSLALFGVASGLFGLFVWQLFASRAIALGAVALFAVHPSMPASLVVWGTNQMHLLTVLTLLVALNLWWARRHDPWRPWLWLLPLQVVACLVKEDGIMLLPAVALLQAAAWGTVDRRAARLPAWPVLVAMPILLAGLLLLRYVALGGPGGYARPAVEQMWLNLARGPTRVLLQWPADRPWQGVVAALVSATTAIGLVLALVPRTGGPARFAIWAGAILVVFFNAPFALVSKVEQYHVLALGGCLLLIGSLVAFADALRTPGLRRAIVAAGVVSLLPMALVSRDIASDWAPLAPQTLAHDRIVMEWDTVAVEIRAFLERKLAGSLPSGAEGDLLQVVDRVTYGLLAPEVERDGSPFQWSSGHVQWFVRSHAHGLRTAVRAIGGERVRIGIEVDGGSSKEVLLDDDSWTPLLVNLPPRARGPWSRMRRIELRVTPTWIPARTVPGSTDTRELGVKLRPIELER